GIGSGLDLNGLLDQLASAERQKLTPITTQKSSYNSKISAFGQLESALDKFQQAAAKLNDADSFRAVKSSVSGDGFTAAAGSDAVAGTYNVSVEQLAQAHSVVFGGVGKKDEPGEFDAGKLTIQFNAIDATEDAIEIDVTADSTLESIRDAINATEGGVTASIINDGGAEPYRLVLTSKETGMQSKMTISSMSSAGEAGAIGLDPDPGTNVGVDAQDAVLKVNGITITSQSNQVEEAIQGVTLNLSKVTGGAADTLTVSQDSAAIKKNVQSFVDAYNSLKASMDSLTSYDAETQSAGTLLGDNTMRSVESSLRRVMLGSVGEGNLQMLSDAGIELKLDGKLEVNSDKLDDLIAESPESLSRFFGGTEESDGFADQLDTALSAMLDEKGLIANATEGLKDRISSLDDRYERVESSINSTIERYRAQFADMDMLVSEMNSTMSYLTQQFESMNAQLGRD
ncbi:flagellar filament capping protein FliD, partial [Halomonas sp. BBD48]|nr:flagellar filament capping protein FliD [Halomonas sp. BBD48]